MAQKALPPSFFQPREISAAARGGPDASTLRILTWNIDRGANWRKIAKGLRESKCDLCLLQEVDWGTARSGGEDVGAKLAEALELYGEYAIEFEELGQERGRPAYIGQATLSRLRPQQSRVLRFRRQSGFWQPQGWMPSSAPLLQRRMGDRVALVTEYEFANHSVAVYNAHLESRSFGAVQREQLAEMTADVKSHYRTSTLVLVGGDLNTKYFPSRFASAMRTAGFTSVTGEQMERTTWIPMTLDWLFVRGSWRVTSGVVRHDMKGSDHLPVSAELEVYQNGG